MHPDAEKPLNTWYHLVSKNEFANFNESKAIFPSADAVKNKNGDSLTVFNIHGNNVRLIAAIYYNRKTLFVRHILTHAEYDKGKWKL
ncbi:type II toxin-antitoxin system HigB family toxin [Methylovulum psychrotolerans]|uniref:Type II toxin-antitoxin system HigB family toxin n=1 Tax=Methylovulum psychrotolerans TaxID=1704499 RepID=A0A2S5CK45_9GAMM|nr:type II toxin-antitoxin system HigB family toxin [Methylovulum psychrotolerans]POZ51181.1 type II toxin-antitoxin system HigB family toxin [Methylovulum psychrotolerans]